MLPRRPRLAYYSYTGRSRYFLTFCTSGRCRLLVSDEIVSLVWSQILRAAGERTFNILAHVVMPDHLHLLAEGTAQASDLKRFASLAKQRSAFEYQRRTHRRLWQPSHYDHVLRDEESTLPFIRYILENPVRAGLARTSEEYPYAGAGPLSVAQMVEQLNGAGVEVWEPVNRRIPGTPAWPPGSPNQGQP